MNFLRQQADAFLAKRQLRPLNEEAKCQLEPPSEPLVVRDAEMDAAVEELEERLSNLRAQTTLQRIRNQKELDQLNEKIRTASERWRDNVHTLIKRAQMGPYLEATKRVEGELFQTGVVITLQAQLCMHVHGLCMHQEQLVRLKSENNEIVFWYEDMVKQLRRDQAENEMTLMNQLVMTKIQLGELVDAKKLRERQEERTLTQRSLSRRFSRSVSHSTMDNQLSKKMQSPRQSGRPQQGGTSGAQKSGDRQRTIRQISTRGTALHKNDQKLQTMRNMKNLTVPTLDNQGVPVSKVNRMASASLPENMRLQNVQSESKKPLPPPEAIVERGEGEEKEGRKETAVGLQPSEEIAALRAARAEARRSGRPLRRGVQRTRSRSLTSMKGEGRGGRKPVSQPSQDDTNVSRRSATSSGELLLVGFPKPRALDDSYSMMSRRGSSRELLRGFSPAPSVLPRDSSQLSTVATPGEEGGTLRNTFRNWMGTMAVILQPNDGGLSTLQNKIALVG